MSEMRDLYASTVTVMRLQSSFYLGRLTTGYAIVNEVLDPYLGVPGQMKCRLDMNFMRPGKDVPMAVQAGRSPDRMGVLFCDYTPHLKADDIIVTTYGPTVGTFQIRQIPDVPPDYNSAHHIEVQCVEVSQSMEMPFPGSDQNRHPEEPVDVPSPWTSAAPPIPPSTESWPRWGDLP